MLGLPLPAEGRPADEDRLIRLYQGLAPATVFLTSTYARNPQVSQWPTGVGSGFILDQEGTVLTSAHVVDNAATIMATLHDGQRVKAELIGSDSYTDLAVVRLIDFKGKLPTVQLGDSDRLQIGQRALVVGNAFGLGFTLSSGVISGMRQLQPSIDPVVPWMIQTTAPINPGNSGGPLVDYDGRVIGVARSILRGAQNIGFATPINTAKDVLRELKTNGRMVRPWLGVSGLFITQDIVDLFAMPMTVGILVVDVEHGSPADQAGLMAGNLHVAIEGNPLVLGGDIITSLNGQPISSPETFVQGVRSLRLGEPLDIRFHRLGQAHKVQAKVTERPSESMGVAKLPDEEVVSAPQRTSSRADGLDRYIDF